MKRLSILFFTVFISLSITHVNAQEPVEIFIADFTDDALRLTMEQTASNFLSDVNVAFAEKSEGIAGSDYFMNAYTEEFAVLWNSTPFYIPENTIIESANRLATGRYEMRNIPAYFVDPDGEEHYEEAVIQFTPSGLISEFRIGLAAHRFQEIMDAGEDEIDNANRETILSFVENFRTSYNRKDIDYINTVFSDQALIIVGRVIENTGEESAYQQQVEYLQFTKGEYIERLRRLFARNEWINVGYEDIGIIRHPKHPEIYGVSLTQYYSSATYSDEGYLFLLIDFEDPDKPLIHVRTWQPKRATPEDEVFHIGYMEIFK
jgi:hypothetical protein